MKASLEDMVMLLRRGMQEEGRNCSHCGTWIPYSIHDRHWYCFECGFYTDNDVPLDYVPTGHKHQWKVAPVEGGIVHFCATPFCEISFTQTTRQYEKDLEKTRERNYVHSREWKQAFEAADSYRRDRPLPSLIAVPVKNIEEASPKELAQFERFLQRKVDSRDRRYQRKKERRLGK